MEVISGKLAPRPTKLDRLQLIDMYGVRHSIRAYGIPSILNTGTTPDLTGIKHLYPSAPAKIYERPVGPVDILLSKDNRRLQARQVDEEELGLSLIKFGFGYVLNGYHPALTFQPIRPSAMITVFSWALTEIPMRAQVLSIQREYPRWLSQADKSFMDPIMLRPKVCIEVKCGSGNKAAGVRKSGLEHANSMPPLQFHEAEELWCSPEPKCSTCKGCKVCSGRLRNLSRDDQARIETMEPR